MTPTAPRPRTAEKLGTGVLVALVTTGAYWAWLGWDRARDVHPDGHVTGPYEAWQVIGLVLTLLVAGVIAARRGAPLITAAAVTLALTASWCVGAITSDDPGIWPVGAALLFIGTIAAGLPVAFLAHLTRTTRG